MGPSCSIADVKADEATVWSPTQGVYPLRTAVARVLGFRDQQVHVIYKEGSGCYGLNGADTASIDATLLSKAVGRAGPRAVDALGRARLGALRDADGDEGEGRARQGREPRRLGLREHPGLAWWPPRQHRCGEPADRRPDRAHARARAGGRPDVPAARCGHVEHGGRVPEGRGRSRPQRPRDREDGLLISSSRARSARRRGSRTRSRTRASSTSSRRKRRSIP